MEWHDKNTFLFFCFFSSPHVFYFKYFSSFVYYFFSPFKYTLKIKFKLIHLCIRINATWIKSLSIKCKTILILHWIYFIFLDLVTQTNFILSKSNSFTNYSTYVSPTFLELSHLVQQWFSFKKNCGQSIKQFIRSSYFKKL